QRKHALLLADKKESESNFLPGEAAAMAASGGPVQDLFEEATCSICLEYFKDPVIIPECGHNFCRACLIQYWGKSEGEASCPECRKTVQQRNLIPNRSLANVAEKAKMLQQEKQNVTLDPDTAHPHLILSEDRKRVRFGDEEQDLPNNCERFDKHPYVLGGEGFTGGRHFWEVVVGSEGGWAVGVARKSVKRKGQITFGPEEGVWGLGKWAGEYKASSHAAMTLSKEPERIRVALNCEGGRVSFYDADRAALLCTFSAAPFSGETLLPLTEQILGDVPSIDF
uniref:Uncharacterized protein n=1 Tax=Podarcis muralis TaxID=64176 RepID=A0A670HZW5_PODMU